MVLDNQRSRGEGALTRRRRFVLGFSERVAESMREAGMLVLVFGLLDYFLGGRQQGPAWPWLCVAIGVILVVMGAAAETTLRRGQTR